MIPDTSMAAQSYSISTFNWLGLLGAGAWLPWIGKWIYNYFIKPSIQVKFFRRYFTITNNASGPFLTLPLSILAKRKNASIREITVNLKNIDSNAEKKYICYSSADVSIRTIVSKEGGRADQWEITPAGIMVLGREFPIMRDFNFSNTRDDDAYHALYNEILRKIGLEKEKNPNFLPDTQYLKQLNEIVQLKKHFRTLTTWTSGNYHILIKISIFERNLPYEFNFSGKFDPVRVEFLTNDYDKYGNWLESDKFITQSDAPFFSSSQITLDVLQ